MSDLKKQYKKPPITFGNVDKIKIDLIDEQRARRRKRRTQDFEENRKKNQSDSQNDVTEKSKTNLLDSRAEKTRKKKAQKKPPFIVGIVRHRFYSPVKKATNVLGVLMEKRKAVAQAQTNSNNKKRVTKVTEKRLLAKAANVETKSKTLETLVNEKSAEISTTDEVGSNVKQRESFAPANHKFQPPDGLLNISLFSQETIMLELSDEQAVSNSSQRRQTNSMASSSSDLTDKHAIKDPIIENPGMPMEEKYTVKYFENALNKEKNRLQKLCEEWTEIQLQDDITEDIRYQINQAVGQTTMLITKKFKKFHNLISFCERNSDDTLITCMDLHGFWDTMYIEVKDCDSRFAKLEKLRARCWKEDQLSVTISPRPKEKIVTTKKITPASLPRTSAILSERKKKMAEIQDKKNSQEMINMNTKCSECITPYIINKRSSVFTRSSNVTRSKRLLEISTNCMYTSTPIPVNATSNTSVNQISTPLIAMKVSQLYDKSMMLFSDMTLQPTPERTLRLSSSVEKSERPRSNSLRMKLARRISSNDYLTMMKSSDKEMHIDRNSETSSKEINRSDSNERIEGKSSSGTDSSGQTVIEKTMCDKNITFRLSSPIDSAKIPAEDKKSVKGSSSNKSSKIKSFGKSSGCSIVNKIKNSVCIPDTVNISPILHKSSLIHNGNISSTTPSLDRIERRSLPKKRNLSIKRACNKTLISDVTPKVNRRIETVSSHKKNIN